jgi:hypothetical protein
VVPGAFPMLGVRLDSSLRSLERLAGSAVQHSSLTNLRAALFALPQARP